jgi:hypothetical protein
MRRTGSLEALGEAGTAAAAIGLLGIAGGRVSDARRLLSALGDGSKVARERRSSFLMSSAAAGLCALEAVDGEDPAAPPAAFGVAGRTHDERGCAPEGETDTDDGERKGGSAQRGGECCRNDPTLCSRLASYAQTTSSALSGPSACV